MKNKMIFFSANWCPSCPSMKTKFANAVAKVKDVDVTYVNVDVDPDLAMSFNIKGVPTIAVVDNNHNVMASYVGARSESELLSIVKQFS